MPGTERAQPPDTAHKNAIFVITNKPEFNRDAELRQQLRTSSGRIEAHLQEGSGQSTDKRKAHYVSIALGSAKEVKGHLSAFATLLSNRLCRHRPKFSSTAISNDSGVCSSVCHCRLMTVQASATAD
jgi:four helix bundle protein